MSDRIDHIDIAKGLSICLVALYHSHLNNYLHYVSEPLSLFRMPLFFFLSGVFFSYSVEFNNFLVKKSEALLKPYFSVSLLLFLIAFILHGEYSEFTIKGIFYGNGDTIRWTPMWFLTHLFVVYCFSYLLFNAFQIREFSLFKKSLLFVILIFIGSLSINFFWPLEVSFLGEDVSVRGLPFSIDIIFLSTAFFVLGVFLKKSVINFKLNLSLFIISVTTFFMVAFFTDAKINLNDRIYLSPFYSTIGAFSGIYIVLSLAILITRLYYLHLMLLKFGYASLFILIFHEFIGGKFYNLSVGYFPDNFDLIIAIFSFSISLLAPLCIMFFISRNNLFSLFFFPVMNNTLLKKYFIKTK